MAWEVSSAAVCVEIDPYEISGLGTLHAWESFGDNVAPDIQAIAKGLGGG